MKTKILKSILLAASLFLIFGGALSAQAKSRHKNRSNNYYQNYPYSQNYDYRNNYNYGYGNRYENYNYYDSGYYPNSRPNIYPADLDPSYGPTPGCWADPYANRIFCDSGRN